MKRTKYFINLRCGVGTIGLKRLKNRSVDCFSPELDMWVKSTYYLSDLKHHPFSQITRDEARKRCPKAFRKA